MRGKPYWWDYARKMLIYKSGILPYISMCPYVTLMQNKDKKTLMDVTFWEGREMLSGVVSV